MHCYVDSLLSHGSGPLRQIAFVFGGCAIRFSVGGYGNIRRPAGTWSILPSRTVYRGQAYYIHWLNLSVSYLPHAYRYGALCGYKKVF